jgi:uncharacterized protein (TIGR02391 family)
MFNKNNFTNKNFNKGLVDAIGNRLENNNYEDTIKQALLYLTEILRNKTGLINLDGDKIITQAFSANNPKIQVNSLKNTNDKNEQQGVMYLGQAIYSAFRNPLNHSIDVKISEKDCIRQLIIIDMLLDYSNREIRENNKLSNVLFDRVDSDNKEFYLYRDIDKEVKQILKLKHIWLYGESGTGKTSLATYCTLEDRNRFIHTIYFSEIEENNIEDIIQNIYESLEDRAESENIDLISINKNMKTQNKLKKILCLFSNKFEKVTLIFDDIQEIEEKEFHNFFKLILIILQNHSNGNECNLKNLNIIFTSILNPLEYFDTISNTSKKEKLKEILEFKQLNLWTNEELTKLMKKIENNIDELTLHQSIVESSNGKPRELKYKIREELSKG